MSEEAPETSVPEESTPEVPPPEPPAEETPSEAPAEKEIDAEAPAEAPTDAPPEAAPPEAAPPEAAPQEEVVPHEEAAPAEVEPAAEIAPTEAPPEQPAEAPSEEKPETLQESTEPSIDTAATEETVDAASLLPISGAEVEDPKGAISGPLGTGLDDIPEVSEPSEVSEKPGKKLDEDEEDDFDIGLTTGEAETGDIAFDAVEVTETETVAAEQEAEEETKKKKKTKKKKRVAPTPQQRRSLQTEDIDERPRYRAEKEQDIGDFLTDAQSIHLSERMALEEESEEEEEEEESEGSSKEPKETVDRQMYYELYSMYNKQNQREKYRNNYLQKKMGDYYKKRRMEHALRDSEGVFDTVKKYEQQLDILEQLNDTSVSEELRMRMEIEDLRSIRDRKREEIAALFKSMQDAEVQLGKELFTSEEGKGSVDRIVDRLMKHQKQQLMDVIKMRLHFIKIRNRLTEKQEALNALDNLGPNLHLIDYEQLKFDNRNLQDKLEERENELLKLRVRCQNAMQILAHRREKTNALDEDMQNLRDRLEEVSMEYEDAREQLNEMKMNRDILRKNINRINEQAGLLTKKLLLKDMEAATKEVKVISTKLETYKVEYEQTKGYVNNVRKNLQSNSKMDFFKAAAKGIEYEDEDDKWVVTD